MKKFLALALTLVMALSLSACGGKVQETAPKTGEDGYHISVIIKSSSEYWQYIIAGAEAYDKDHPNVTVEIKGPPSETSYDEQQNMIETDIRLSGQTTPEVISRRRKAWPGRTGPTRSPATTRLRSRLSRERPSTAKRRRSPSSPAPVART